VKYLITLGLALGVSAFAESPETLLFADFFDKPLNEPIGTGGAAEGEPDSISPAIDAVVRAAPGGGRELELSLESTASAHSVRFQFLELEEVTDGRIKTRVDLRLGSKDQFSRVVLLLREANGASQSFLNLDLFNDGETQIRRNGFSPVRFPDTALLSTLNTIEVLFDLDEKTLSFCMNGQLLIAGLDSGIETKRGIGGVYLSLPSQSETLVWLDRIEVNRITRDDRVFADRFDDGLAPCPF